MSSADVVSAAPSAIHALADSTVDTVRTLVELIAAQEATIATQRAEIDRLTREAAGWRESSRHHQSLAEGYRRQQRRYGADDDE